MPLGAAPPDLDAFLAPLGYRAHFQYLRRPADGEVLVSFEIRWKQTKKEPPARGLIEAVASEYPVRVFQIDSRASH